MTAFVFDRRDPKRLLIASDTLGYTLDSEHRPLGYVDKVYPLARLRAVLMCRGAQQIAAEAAAHLALRPDVVTFEDAVEALPDVLRLVTHHYAAAYGIADHKQLMLADVILAGRSSTAKLALTNTSSLRVREDVRAFRNYEDYEPVPDDYAPGISCLPFPPAGEFLAKGLDRLPPDRVLTEVMLAMQRHFLARPEDGMPVPIGGEVIVHEITDSGISCRVVHRFADAVAVGHAGAAVRARFEREYDGGPLDFSGVARADGAPVRELTRQERKMARRARRAA